MRNNFSVLADNVLGYPDGSIARRKRKLPRRRENVRREEHWLPCRNIPEQKSSIFLISDQTLWQVAKNTVLGLFWRSRRERAGGRRRISPNRSSSRNDTLCGRIGDFSIYSDTRWFGRYVRPIVRSFTIFYYTTTPITMAGYTLSDADLPPAGNEITTSTTRRRRRVSDDDGAPTQKQKRKCRQPWCSPDQLLKGYPVPVGIGTRALLIFRYHCCSVFSEKGEEMIIILPPLPARSLQGEHRQADLL